MKTPISGLFLACLLLSVPLFAIEHAPPQVLWINTTSNGVKYTLCRPGKDLHEVSPIIDSSLSNIINTACEKPTFLGWSTVIQCNDQTPVGHIVEVFRAFQKRGINIMSVMTGQESMPQDVWYYDRTSVWLTLGERQNKHFSSSLSDRFVLIDVATTNRYGPYCFLDGHTLDLPDRSYRIYQSDAPHAETVQCLKNTILPSITIRDMDVFQAVAKIQKEADGLIKKSNRIALIVTKKNATLYGLLSPINNDPFGDPFNYYRAPAFSAQGISLFDTINLLCELMDLRFRTLDKKVIIYDPNFYGPPYAM